MSKNDGLPDMMEREFVKDGWRFTVKVYDWDGRRVKVIFHKAGLPKKESEDVFVVTEDQPKTYEEVEVERSSFAPFTLNDIEEQPVPYESLQEQVEVAMEKAWDRIEGIEESPSEQFDDVIESLTDDE